MLIRLLYVSRAVNGTASPQEIAAIVDSAKTYNVEHGITGILCYGAGIYLQAIEGARDEVNRLYARLLSDSRHEDLVLLHYEEILERRFGHWHMGKVNLAKLNTSVVLKYSERPVLDPYRVSGKVSLALLEELMLTASIVGRT